jgi:hypothetical protein
MLTCSCLSLPPLCLFVGDLRAFKIISDDIYHRVVNVHEGASRNLLRFLLCRSTFCLRSENNSFSKASFRGTCSEQKILEMQMYDSLSRLKAVENIPEGNLDIHRNGQET